MAVSALRVLGDNGGRNLEFCCHGSIFYKEQLWAVLQDWKCSGHLYRGSTLIVLKPQPRLLWSADEEQETKSCVLFNKLASMDFTAAPLFFLLNKLVKASKLHGSLSLR